MSNKVDAIKYNLLKDSVISTAVGGTRIYNQKAPSTVYDTVTETYDEAKLPFIVIRQIGSVYSRQADRSIHDFSFAIECYATSITQSEKLGQYVAYNLNQSRAYEDHYPEIIMISGIILGERSYSLDDTNIQEYDVDVQISFKETLAWA